MKKLFLVICILFICGCAQKKDMHDTILEYFTNINNDTNITSSNPFDYTKSEYYKKIVELGKDAVPVLESLYNEGEIIGVDAYLSALAIQEITGCDVSKEYDVEWEDADEFFELWYDHKCMKKEYDFQDIYWERETEEDIENLYFGISMNYSYSCGCGNPVDDSDLCETYSYDVKTKVITLNCEDKKRSIKVIKNTDNTLELDFDGDIRVFKKRKK